MKKNRPTIGRTLNPAVFNNEDLNVAANAQVSQVFTLSTGRQATFVEITVPPELVESDTFVIQENNGRDQSSLTPESLKDIRRTFKHQQFYPAIGVRSEGKIEILDGSRRRAAAILEGVGLRVLVTDQGITNAEAQHLAKDLQTAVQHSIREIGLRLMRLKNSGMSQKDIAASEGMSPAKVTRALQAASAPEDLITLFPVQSELTFSDYKALCAVGDELGNQGMDLEELVKNISPEIDKVLADDGMAEDEVKNRILRIITKEASLLTNKGSKDKSVVSELWKFDDKDRFARKRVKGRAFSYEFNRLPKELQDELDRMISHLLKRGLDKKGE
ncbi:ParB family protein (plasmid) [Raoultella ornithinolytica]|uniref:ParB family protein n=1 Tax=Raoultella ornithinolytica TaxID=54291 RepID=UPI00292AC87F|nr:ParB family protein [Raoultella ornithinolytica]MDV1094955.1 ParB family protein [Raoultella ornithinolytica]MDV1122701.1 ParB family protein [Raoultella ornithinolytica]MDV1893216.1 ParB family protein [Raoultella ornithinolytica]